MADRDRVGSAWGAPGAGERYTNTRFRSHRAGQRDPALVARALARHGLTGDDRPARVLDIPSGSGRLREVLASTGAAVVAADVSPAMLAADERELRVRASVFALPFHDGAFDAVVCCRLLHHLREPEDLKHAVTELVRVSARLVVASFWDAGSLPALRKRLGLKPLEARVAIGRDRLAALFAHNGAPVVDYEHSMRFVSQQAFAIARKDA